MEIGKMEISKMQIALIQTLYRHCSVSLSFKPTRVIISSRKCRNEFASKKAKLIFELGLDQFLFEIKFYLDQKKDNFSLKSTCQALRLSFSLYCDNPHTFHLQEVQSLERAPGPILRYKQRNIQHAYNSSLIANMLGT